MKYCKGSWVPLAGFVTLEGDIRADLEAPFSNQGWKEASFSQRGFPGEGLSEGEIQKQ